MGFKCPFCKTDFGHDKDAFDKHMKDENKDFSIVDLVTTNLADTMKNVMGSIADTCQAKTETINEPN